jgi:hypothetical protein
MVGAYACGFVLVVFFWLKRPIYVPFLGLLGFTASAVVAAYAASLEDHPD